jgi:hypothetical protein
MNKKIIIGAFIVLIILILEICYYAQNGTKVIKLNNMYKDIEILEDKISIYYLNYGILPQKNEKIDFLENSINPNDSENYYEIDLEKLENLNINYGKKIEDEKDFYIINEESHTIYYYKGIELNGEKIYSKKTSYQKILLEDYQ